MKAAIVLDKMYSIRDRFPIADKPIRFRYLSQEAALFADGVATCGPGGAKWFEKVGGTVILWSRVTHWKYV